MIKVIAFDLVGVLVKEKDIEMNIEEQKLERLFGPNKSDKEYINAALNIIDDREKIIRLTTKIIKNLYEVKDKGLFNKIKNRYPYIKIVIATNHVSFIKDFINLSLDVRFIDYIFISADINEIKPNKGFYDKIINQMNASPSEILFLDDNDDNIIGAQNSNLKTIKVNKTMDLFYEIEKIIGNNE